MVSGSSSVERSGDCSPGPCARKKRHDVGCCACVCGARGSRALPPLGCGRSPDRATRFRPQVSAFVAGQDIPRHRPDGHSGDLRSGGGVSVRRPDTTQNAREPRALQKPKQPGSLKTAELSGVGPMLLVYDYGQPAISRAKSAAVKLNETSWSVEPSTSARTESVPARYRSLSRPPCPESVSM